MIPTSNSHKYILEIDVDLVALYCFTREDANIWYDHTILVIPMHVCIFGHAFIILPTYFKVTSKKKVAGMTSAKSFELCSLK